MVTEAACTAANHAQIEVIGHSVKKAVDDAVKKYTPNSNGPRCGNGRVIKIPVPWSKRRLEISMRDFLIVIGAILIIGGIYGENFDAITNLIRTLQEIIRVLKAFLGA
jgi:hypothetical protein